MRSFIALRIYFCASQFINELLSAKKFVRIAGEFLSTIKEKRREASQRGIAKFRFISQASEFRYSARIALLALVAPVDILKSQLSDEKPKQIRFY